MCTGTCPEGHTASIAVQVPKETPFPVTEVVKCFFDGENVLATERVQER